jgi:CRISPR-associated protein Cas6
MDATAVADTVVDVAFPLSGTHLPRDHAQSLSDALTGLLPWLAEEPVAGIHTVKVVPGYGARALLSRRARLLLRVPEGRVDALFELANATLDVAGCALRLGEPRPRDLLPHGTLFAPVVAAAPDDEVAFMRDVAEALRAMQVDGHSVCGRRRRVATSGGWIAGFSLMLHGLSAADSLRVQCVGIGPARLLGCGIFVPHRSAAAVGA